MEHRLNVRKPLRRNVVIAGSRVAAAAVTLRDMSAGGMRVDGSDLLLPLHGAVIVTVDLGDGERRNDFVLEAMVVRHTDSGAALMFSDLETAELRALHAAIGREGEGTGLFTSVDARP